MKTHRDIIDRWPAPSIRTFAEDVGLKYVTAQLMRYRNSIAAEHWLAVVAAAERRGFSDITLGVLAELKGVSGKPDPKTRAYQPAA